ncbi:LYR motif-containing protein 4 [Planoprotostelium fungivorum]|uniref:LYR motif-containing protein 4 n=1 Tax=Planoprotostelium fungivorum TaxID=1890364 RepID=A0A2P6NHD8_9EUKA|nr:LYR motif-containing protein 4 [Planoprotostelium fungivorum]
MSRVQTLGLYRDLVRQAKQFNSYNFREYALRRVRTGFEEGRNVDAEGAKNLYDFGKKELHSLKRQTMEADYRESLESFKPFVFHSTALLARVSQ